MRLHVGSGDIYLDGWLNVDVPGPKTFLAEERPDLVDKCRTTEDDYYRRHGDVSLESLSRGPRTDTEYICDAYGTFERLPAGIWVVDEILARHSFEHLSVTEAHRALDECDRVLRAGGILRLDVPDTEATLAKLVSEEATVDPFAMRHLLGPRTSPYGYHMMGYTKEGLRKFVEEHGFVFLEEEPNIHCYPALCLRFQKAPPPLPRDYALRGIDIPVQWKVLDVGPGRYPLFGGERQNVWYCDRDDAVLSQLPLGQAIRADFNVPLLFKDKEFDFVFCSHVAEHVEDPVAFAQELSRVGKGGVLVTPHAMKDAMFLFEERQHIWWYFPPERSDGPVRAMRADQEFIRRVATDDARKVLCRLYRTGPNRLDYDQRVLRRWFYEKEPHLDVITRWHGELKIEVIG